MGSKQNEMEALASEIIAKADKMLEHEEKELKQLGEERVVTWQRALLARVAKLAVLGLGSFERASNKALIASIVIGIGLVVATLLNAIAVYLAVKNTPPPVVSPVINVQPANVVLSSPFSVSSSASPSRPAGLPR